MNLLRFALPLSLILTFAGCVTYEGMDDGDGGRYGVPKITKKGNPEILYSMKESDVKDVFPHGMDRDLVIEKYGKPLQTYTHGNGDGKVTYTDFYSYSLDWNKISPGAFSYESHSITKSTSVTIIYNEKNKLSTITFTNYQKINHYIDAKSNIRDATDAEIEQTFGSKQPIVPVTVSGNEKSNSTSNSEQNVGEASASWKLGIRVSFTKPDSKIKGIVVDEVISQGLAEKAGIRVSDIITKVNDESIENGPYFVDALKKAKTTSPLKLRVVTKGKGRNVIIQPIEKGLDV